MWGLNLHGFPSWGDPLAEVNTCEKRRRAEAKGCTHSYRTTCIYIYIHIYIYIYISICLSIYFLFILYVT